MALDRRMPSELTYMTTSDVARHFGVNPSAVRRWVLAGKLHPTITTPGGHHRFTDEDIAAMKAEPALAGSDAVHGKASA